VGRPLAEIRWPSAGGQGMERIPDEISLVKNNIDRALDVHRTVIHR
jgi:hypothetical protein